METSVSSLVSPDIVSQFNQVFSNLATNDNDLRTTAEKQLNEQWLAQQPNLLLLSLTQLGRTHDKIEVNSYNKHITHMQLNYIQRVLMYFSNFLGKGIRFCSASKNCF